MPAWTPQQLQCLEALNIPVMAFVKPQSCEILSTKSDERTATRTTPASNSEASAPFSSPATTAESVTPSSAPATAPEITQSFYYRLGPWFFQTSAQLPVNGVAWINDLAAFADTRLSQTSRVTDAFNIDAYVHRPLTPEQKRELWQSLQARLTTNDR